MQILKRKVASIIWLFCTNSRRANDRASLEVGRPVLKHGKEFTDAQIKPRLLVVLAGDQPQQIRFVQKVKLFEPNYLLQPNYIVFDDSLQKSKERRIISFKFLSYDSRVEVSVILIAGFTWDIQICSNPWQNIDNINVFHHLKMQNFFSTSCSQRHRSFAYL